MNPFERHYTLDELAAMWQVDINTLRAQFNNYPGVVDLANRAQKKRRYRKIRVPESIVAKFYQERMQGRVR